MRVLFDAGQASCTVLIRAFFCCFQQLPTAVGKKQFMRTVRLNHTIRLQVVKPKQQAKRGWKVSISAFRRHTDWNCQGFTYNTMSILQITVHLIFNMFYIDHYSLLMIGSRLINVNIFSSEHVRLLLLSSLQNLQINYYKFILGYLLFWVGVAFSNCCVSVVENSSH